MADDLPDAPWANGGSSGGGSDLPDAPWAASAAAPERSFEDELSRQAFSGIVKGVAGLPGVPGYLLGATGRAADWAARKMMTPEQYEFYQKDLERRGMAGHETILPTPESFIKPVEEHITGPLAEATKPWHRYVQAASAGAPFGPAATLASLAGEAAAHAAEGTGYEEAAGLGAGLLAPRGLRTVGNVARNTAERLEQAKPPRPVPVDMDKLARDIGVQPGSVGAAAVSPLEQASEFNIPLSRGQAEQNMDAIRYEDMAARGAYGKPAQDVAVPWFQSQFGKIGEAGQGIGERLAGEHPVVEGTGEAASTINAEVAQRAAEARRMRGEAQQQAQQAGEATRGMVADQARSIEEALRGGFVPIENIREAGEVVATDVRAQAAADRAHYRSLYDEAFALPGEFHAGAFEGIGQRIRGELSQGDSPVIIDNVTTPVATRAINDVENISNLRIQNLADPAGAPNPENIVGVDLRGVDQARKRLVAYYQAARSAAPMGQVTPDVRAMGRIMEAFDNQVEHSIANGLFSGDERALAALQEARAAYRNYAQTYRPRGSGDDVGAAIRRIVDRRATPEETVNMILGSGRIGNAGLPVRLADRLEQILGRDSDGWSTIRQAMWQRASQVRNAAGEIDPVRSAASIDQFAQSSLGQRMFEPYERAAMRDHAAAVRQLDRAVELLPETETAERAARGYETMFGGEGIGGAQQAVFRRIVEGTATPEETANAVFGAIGSGNPGNAVRMIGAIERIAGTDSPTMSAMRQGVWQRLTQAASGKDQPGAQKLAQNINEFLNGRGRTIAEKLYTPDELAQMQRYADVVKRTVIPKYARTNSDTAPAIAGMARKIASGLAGAVTHVLPGGRFMHWGVEKLIDRVAGKLSDAKEARKVAESLDYGKRLEQSAASQGGLDTPEVGRQPLQRKVIESSRAGRPTKTEPLPIGNEQRVLERGLQRLNEGPRIVSKQQQEAILRKNWKEHGEERDWDFNDWRPWDREVKLWNQRHPNRPMPGPGEVYEFGTNRDFEKMFHEKYLAGRRADFPGVKEANEYFQDDRPDLTAYTSMRQIPEDLRPPKRQALERQALKTERFSWPIRTSYGKVIDDMPITVNPSRSAIQRELAQAPHGDVRLLRDPSGNLYMWPANEAMHVDIANNFDMPFRTRADLQNASYLINKKDVDAVGRFSDFDDLIKKLGDGVPERAAGGRVDAVKTRRESHYSPTRGTAERRCGNCSMFRAPNRCTAVGGDIAKAGKCDWWEPKVERANGGRTNHAPTEAQKQAGNYAKRSVRIQGLDILIENEKDSTRSGTDKDGKPWSVKMPAHYGYIKGTVGRDKDHVDVYLGPHIKAPRAWIVDQQDHETKRFDEHKVFVGFASEAQVRRTYAAAFNDGNGPARIKAIYSMMVPDLRRWLREGDTKRALSDQVEQRAA